MADRIGPGGCIGILGGGQLGRMLALAAARLGLRVHVFEPAADPCAAPVVERVVRAGYDDAAALRDFAAGVDVVSYEFENVDLGAIDALEPHVLVRPGRRALAVSQDRLAEKEFLTGLGLATAPFAAVDGDAGLATRSRGSERPRSSRPGVSATTARARRASPETRIAGRRWPRSGRGRRSSRASSPSSGRSR
jgi:5-(carboxyamino)imidazole ribonucleotide synthase